MKTGTGVYFVVGVLLSIGAGIALSTVGMLLVHLTWNTIVPHVTGIVAIGYDDAFIIAGSIILFHVLLKLINAILFTAKSNNP